MPQVTWSTRALMVGCALLAVIAVGCSKKNGAPFDPDAGHPADFFPSHPTEYRSALESCDRCHGTDLLGGISTVSCYSSSRDGQSCHPGGPGGHPPGWRALHSADPSKAAICAPCHDNKDNNLAPNCFDNSLCHGPKSGHPAGWRSAHTRTNPGQASYCAGCHQANPGAPGCFNNTLCHGAKSSHPAGWRTTHQGTQQGAATICAGCHPDKGQPTCFANSACHGSGGGHPDGWSAGSQHGKTAEGNPGMIVCTACHGAKFGGGAGPSCLNCHGGNAPHPKNNWGGENGRHHVNTANTKACALCHSQLAGSSNCLNTNGCHGD
ncbi:MAG: hypothetical protein ACYC9Y_01925 [Candidatus Methylomirabilia bacterium]